MPSYIFNKYKTYVYVYVYKELKTRGSEDIIYVKMNFYPYGLYWVINDSV